MAKDGPYSSNSGPHSREGLPTWRRDQHVNKRRSKDSRYAWVRVPVAELVKREELSGEDPDADLRGQESGLELFRSDVRDLRPHPNDSWGYRIIRRLTEEEGVPVGQPDLKLKRKAGRPPKRASLTSGRDLVAGEPAIDDGADALVQFPSGDLSIPENLLTEDHEKNDLYVQTLNVTASILRTHDYLAEKSWTRKKKGWKKKRAERREAGLDDEPPEMETVVGMELRDRKPRARGQSSHLHRKTVDLPPWLSRAVQIMIADGLVQEAREILDDLILPLCKEFERIFPGAKVVAAGWHVRSGQLHLDMWTHGTWLEKVEVGIEKKETTARLWNPDGLCHFGPGPGICAWNRHLKALGDEAADLCPGIVDEVTKALTRAEERGLERELAGKGAGLANRDIAIHNAFDEFAGAALPVKYVAAGMEAYRAHLRELYESGGDPKLTPEMITEREEPLARRIAESKRMLDEAASAKENADNFAAKTEKLRIEAANVLVTAKKEASTIVATANTAGTAITKRENAVVVLEAGISARESKVVSSRVSLAGKIRTMRSHIRVGITAQTKKALAGIAKLVLGEKWAKALVGSEKDLAVVVGSEITRLRKSEEMLTKVVGGISVKPGTPAAALVGEAKTLLAEHTKSREIAGMEVLAPAKKTGKPKDDIDGLG